MCPLIESGREDVPAGLYANMSKPVRTGPAADVTGWPEKTARHEAWNITVFNVKQ